MPWKTIYTDVYNPYTRTINTRPVLFWEPKEGEKRNLEPPRACCARLRWYLTGYNPSA